MPYHLEGNCVMKGDKQLKCYDNHKEALDYLRALEANVKDSILASASMYITKSSLSDGVMKWFAVNSDTEWDIYEERMTLVLYQSMLKNIKLGTPPPDAFKSMVVSDYWNGGMPYLSIAHYPDLNGKAVPGKPTELFIDGNQLKAKGTLFDSELGRAVWKSLKEDEKSLNDEKIRISIAFLDLKHKHGEDGQVFQRDSLSSICPDCEKGEGNKIYLDGYLVHLALTRVPVNPRTIMQIEDIMARKAKIETRKEDAESIIGEELTETIDKSALEVKSDVLVEMSDAVGENPETPVVEDSHHKVEGGEMADDEDVPDEGDKKKKDKKEYKALTAEDVATIVRSTLEELVQVKPVVETNTVSEKSALDLATDELYNSIDSAISLQGVSLEQKLDAINPALQKLGTSITALVKESMGITSPATVSNDQSQVLEAISNVANSVKELAQKVSIIEEKSKTSTNNVNRIPVPRSIQAPQLVTQSQTNQAVNPKSVHNIVRRSVHSTLQPE